VAPARLLAVLVLVLALAACGADDEPDEAAPPEPPPAEEPEPPEEPPDEPEPEPEAEPSGELALAEPDVVATGLEIPWALAFLPDGTILVTERPGRVRAVRDGELQAEPVAEIADVVHRGEGGLHGIAVHPDFDEHRLVYVYYTAADGNRISRFPLGEDLSFGEEHVLLRGIPAASIHNGGALAFGPDGMLYATAGDAGDPDAAADPQSLAGAVLRLTPEGNVPDDNPHGDSPVWSTGHRNPQGLAWDDEGRLYASEHGPTGEFGLCCLDEVNLVEAGDFHGWPVRAGRQATNHQVAVPSDPVDPVAASGPDTTWAPGGIALHPESRSILLPNLAGQQLLHFTLAEDDPREVVEAEVALDGYGRLRAIERGPGDCFYVTTSNRDGRGSPADDDDRLLRLCPAG
jgi:aldose sugar dehydrogenase